jgi:hypothetical protein
VSLHLSRARGTSARIAIRIAISALLALSILLTPIVVQADTSRTYDALNSIASNQTLPHEFTIYFAPETAPTTEERLGSDSASFVCTEDSGCVLTTLAIGKGHARLLEDEFEITANSSPVRFLPLSSSITHDFPCWFFISDCKDVPRQRLGITAPTPIVPTPEPPEYLLLLEASCVLGLMILRRRLSSNT